jgi:hypothetical protein
MAEPKYLSGDTAGITKFLDRFDVWSCSIAHLSTATDPTS